MPSRKTAWVEAALIFCISRLVILFLTVIATLRLPLLGQTATRNCAFDSTPCLLSWFHWDAIAYVNVADHGYSLTRNTVFFPLWPLLIHWVGTLFGASTTSYYVAGLLLANVFFYLALVVFYRLLSEDFEPTVAKNALFYLTFYPYALFFFAGYAESLFLLLCLAVFFFLQHERWWLAGLCGFLAALTRSPGVLLAVPFLITLLQRIWTRGRDVQTNWQQKLQACLPLVLIPSGVLVFMLYLGITKGNPIAFSTEEAQSWNRHLTLPFISIITAIQTFFHPSSLILHLLNFLDLAFTLIPLAILAIGWKHLPLHYSLFALVAALFSLSYPQGTIDPLTAAPRFMMVIFPIIVILAIWGKQPRLDRIVTACLLPIFAINVVLFINHYWVA